MTTANPGFTTPPDPKGPPLGSGPGPLARFKAYIATPTGKKTLLGLGAVAAVGAGLWARRRATSTGDSPSTAAGAATSLVPSTGTVGGGSGGGISGEAISDSLNALSSSLAQSLGEALAAASAQSSAADAQQLAVLDSLKAGLDAVATAQRTSPVTTQAPATGAATTPTGITTGREPTQAEQDNFLRAMAAEVDRRVGAGASQAIKDQTARQIVAEAQAAANRAAIGPQQGGNWPGATTATAGVPPRAKW